MPTIRWPAQSTPQPSQAHSAPLGPDFVALSLHQSVLLEGVTQALESRTRLRLYRFGQLVWERVMRPTEPRPLRAWVHDTGLSAIVGDWSCGQWLSLLDPGTGQLIRVVDLHSVLRQSGSTTFDGGREWLRFSTAGFVEIPGRGVCFSLRAAHGPRILVDPRQGAFVPSPFQEEALRVHEAERALATLAELECGGEPEPFQLPLASQERLGAATLVAVEQGLKSAVCALRALEWGGGPCRPGLRRPGDVNPALADVYDLRRLAQRALLRLGELPRPLAGARVIRVGPKAALPTSLDERACVVTRLMQDLPERMTPLAVLARAGQPDDVGPGHWDYGLYSGEMRTLRLSWSRPLWGQVPRLESIQTRSALAATSSYRGLELPLDPLAS
jgi:hypothetical protein